MSFDADLGPLDYLVVTFPDAPVPASGFDELNRLADAGTILVLDVEFVAKSADGTVTRPDAASVGAAGVAHADAGLIDEDDVAAVADQLAPGAVAAVVVYENLAILSAVSAWQQDGGELVAEGPIVVDDLVAALDRAETN